MMTIMTQLGIEPKLAVQKVELLQHSIILAFLQMGEKQEAFVFESVLFPFSGTHVPYP
jgi:hypothetical protein